MNYRSTRRQQPESYPRRSSLRLGFGGLMLAVLLGAAACSSSDDSSEQVASLDEEVTSAPTTAESTDDAGDDGTVEEDFEAAFAQYEDCMVDQGVPAFESDGNNVDVDGGPASLPEDFDMEIFRTANEECQYILEEVTETMDVSPAEQAALDDYSLALGDCLADRGIDIPVDDDEAATEMLFEMTTEEIEEFQIAVNECQKEVPIPSNLTATSDG